MNVVKKLLNLFKKKKKKVQMLNELNISIEKNVADENVINENKLIKTKHYLSEPNLNKLIKTEYKKNHSFVFSTCELEIIKPKKNIYQKEIILPKTQK